MEPFDRDDFVPWPGALRLTMRAIDKGVQRRHGMKAPGLRWGKSAPRVRCGACPMPRIAPLAAPARKVDLPPLN